VQGFETLLEETLAAPVGAGSGGALFLRRAAVPVTRSQLQRVAGAA